MIETILFFVLGFLSAVLCAMAVAPAIWRRAVLLTRKRIESSVPLTVNELLADKDRLRAEHAMALRKVEMALTRQREQTTEAQTGLSLAKQTIRARGGELKDRDQTIAGLSERLEAETLRADGLSQDLSGTQLELQTVQADLEARSGEIESLERMLADTDQRLQRSVATLADREGELERSEMKTVELRDRLREAQAKVRDSRSEASETLAMLNNEKQRSAELDQRLQKAIAQTSDIEVALSRRTTELVRLRDRQNVVDADFVELERRAADAEREKVDLEGELADLTVRVNRLSKLTGSVEPEAVFEGYQAQTARLTTDVAGEQSRATSAEAALEEARAAAEALERELEEARAAAKAAAEAARTALPVIVEAPMDDAALRNEIARLSAEIVHMAAMLEGDGSRVHDLIDAAADGPGAPGAPQSLADRIKALRAESPDAREAAGA